MTHTLALVMIARNEARCIQRCLASVAGLVDQIVVLDTGSTDDTVALARAAGAEVGHFTWVDDFSAARNASLALSRCDWNLVLDADEVLQREPAALAALQALRQTTPDFVGRIEVCSAFQADARTSATRPVQQEASAWLPRVLPASARFEGLVHEHVAGDWPRQELPIRALHDGYLPAQMQRKRGRNAQLLEAALQRDPGDPYLLYQLGKDHEVQDRFEPAAAAYAQSWQALELLRLPPRTPAWRHDLLLRLLFVLKSTEQVNEAIALAERQLPHWQDSPDFFFVLGDVLLEQAMQQPDAAADLVPMVEQAWQQCLAIGENPVLEGAVSGRGSHLARHNLDALHAVLSGTA